MILFRCAAASDNAGFCTQAQGWGNNLSNGLHTVLVYWFLNPCRLQVTACYNVVVNAGPAGLALAYATGFYANMDVIAWHPESLLDSVPGDVASSMIIAAAALRVSGCNTNAELFCTAEREAMKSSRGSGEPSGSAPGTPSKDSSIPRAWGVNIKTSSTDKVCVFSQAR